MSQRIRACRLFLPPVMGAVLLLLVLLPSLALGQKCTDANGKFVFAAKTYKVRQVRVESIIDFLHAVSSQLDALKPQLPLQPDSDFDLDKSSQGRALIEKKLKEAEAKAEPFTRILIVRARVENCDDPNSANPKLDVVYRILTTNYNAYLSHTWELKEAEIQQPATTAATEQTKGFLTIRPLLLFNRTRQLSPGGQLILRKPGGIFDTLELAGSGSTDANIEDFDLSGSRQPKLAALESIQYRVGYKHSDVPADSNRLRTGTFFAQVFGASSPLGNEGVILRYGAVLEGGNQQSDLVAAASAAGSEASSGYGGLKTYVGATFRRNSYSLSASYGLQLGTAGASSKVDFIKQITNASFSAEWAIGEKTRTCGDPHKPLTLEAEFAAGTIQTRGPLPVSQRFFGGNAEQEFIPGDSWRIRNGPYIRSIPENRLNSQSTLGAIGGTSFYSVNLTVSRPIWGKPIIPKEMEADPQFNLDAVKEQPRKPLERTFMGTIVPAERFKPIIDVLTDPMIHEDDPNKNSVQVNLDLIAKLMAKLPAPEDVHNDPPRDPPCSPQEVADDEPCTKYRRAWQFVSSGSQIMSASLSDDEDSRKLLPGSLLKLLQDNNGPDSAGPLPVPPKPACIDKDPPAIIEPGPSEVESCKNDREQCSFITLLQKDLEALGEILPVIGQNTDEVEPIAKIVASLKAQQDSLVVQLKSIDIHEAKEEADKIIKQIEPVLDAFQHKLNAYSVSPVGIFDAARLWPDKNRTRYGVGGGLRLSVVNLNVTLGYAVNPSPQPREGRGALFFKMDVTDIFR